MVRKMKASPDAASKFVNFVLSSEEQGLAAIALLITVKIV
jgi:ABC-type Fe3+ transport system substrate-binding protein